MLTLLEDNQIDFSPGSGSSVTADDISSGPINNFFLATGSQVFYGPKTFDAFLICNTSGSNIRSLAIPNVLTVHKLNIDDNIYVSNHYIQNGNDLNLATGKLDTALYNISGSIRATINIIPGGTTPNLQQVTNVGATTTNPITVSTSGSIFKNTQVNGNFVVGAGAINVDGVIDSNTSGSNFKSLTSQGPITSDGPIVSQVSGSRFKGLEDQGDLLVHGTVRTSLSGSNFKNLTIQGKIQTDNINVSTSGSQIDCLSVPGLLTAQNLNVGSNIYVSNNYITNGNDLNLATGKLDNALKVVSGSIASTFGGHITIFPSAYDSIGQGTWTWYLDTTFNYILGGTWYNSTAVNGDEISYKVMLPVGTYTLCIMSSTSNNHGIKTCYIDNVVVASFDEYSASFVANVNKKQTGIVISTTGLKTLKVKCVGKNGSSSGYMINIQMISLWRTA